MSTRNLPGGKKRQARRADNLAAICEQIVCKWGVSTSRNPKGLHGLYRDNFTFYSLTCSRFGWTSENKTLRGSFAKIGQDVQTIKWEIHRQYDNIYTNTVRRILSFAIVRSPNKSAEKQEYHWNMRGEEIYMPFHADPRLYKNFFEF
jgi:hypothetical protein